MLHKCKTCKREIVEPLRCPYKMGFRLVMSTIASHERLCKLGPTIPYCYICDPNRVLTLSQSFDRETVLTVELMESHGADQCENCNYPQILRKQRCINCKYLYKAKMQKCNQCGEEAGVSCKPKEEVICKKCNHHPTCLCNACGGVH